MNSGGLVDSVIAFDGGGVRVSLSKGAAGRCVVSGDRIREGEFRLRVRGESWDGEHWFNMPVSVGEIDALLSWLQGLEGGRQSSFGDRVAYVPFLHTHAVVGDGWRCVVCEDEIRCDDGAFVGFSDSLEAADGREWMPFLHAECVLEFCEGVDDVWGCPELLAQQV